MKKIVTVLLAAAMCIVAPAAIFADEFNQYEPVEGKTDSEGSVELKAEITSTYTVKLPKVVDVKADSTDVVIQAKGDVDGSKKIVFSQKNAANDKLADESGKNTAEDLTITFGTGIAGSSIKADYASDVKETMNITHAKLKAGSWKYTLPLLIKLEDITPSQS